MYTAQLSVINATATAINNKIEQLQGQFSWDGVRQAETSLDSMQYKLGRLNHCWVDYLTSVTDLNALQQASILGKAQLRQVAEHMAKLRTDLSQDKPPAPAPVSALTPIPAPSPPQATPSRQTLVRPKVNLENIQIPKFGGNILEYPEFKANFSALTGDEGYKEEMLLIYLKGALPSSAHYLMVGVKDVKTAWQRLDDKYGNRQQRVIAIHKKLIKGELCGKDYDKLEKIHYDMELTQNMLEENEAGASLDTDLYIINTLL